MTKQLALAEDWVPRDVRIKDFVVRHHRTLTFVGALVVFVTVVVKDGLREQLKDLVSSISAAESVFAIRNDTSTTTMWLQRLQEQVDWVAEKIKLKAQAFPVTWSKNYTPRWRLPTRCMRVLEYRSKNISTLIEKVPAASAIPDQRANDENSSIQRHTLTPPQPHQLQQPRVIGS